MSNLSIKRVLAVPTAPFDASTMYIVKGGGANDAELHFSSQDGSTLRHLTTKADIVAMIAAGTSAAADKLTTARKISATGDAAWEVTFDGSANSTAVLTLATTGVTAGEYAVLTVDAKGRVTAGRALTLADLPDLGAAGGIATLDENGFVPASQLPSYVDDIIEANNLAAFPTTGETGKMYLAKDTNLIYRWSGSAYVMIVAGGGISDEALKLHTSRKIELTGDGTASFFFDGSANVSAAFTLADTGVTAGEYAVVTVDSKGRVGAGRDLTEGDMPTLTSTVVESSGAITLAASQW